MASQIYDLVERHLRKLDQELSKFKMELEADCSGITEILERRSLMYNEDTSLDLPFTDYNTVQKENNGGLGIDVKLLAGELDRVPSLTNGITDKPYSTIYSPLGASYPPVKSPQQQQQQPESQQQQPPQQRPTQQQQQQQQPGSGNIGKSTKSARQLMSHTSGSSLLTTPTKSLMNQDNMNKDGQQGGRGAQASLKAMTAAQKKAEQLGNSLSMSGLLSNSSKTPAGNSSSSSSSSYVDVTGNTYSSTFSKQQQRTYILPLQSGIIRRDGWLRQPFMSDRVVPLRLCWVE